MCINARLIDIIIDDCWPDKRLGRTTLLRALFHCVWPNWWSRGWQVSLTTACMIYVHWMWHEGMYRMYVTQGHIYIIASVHIRIMQKSNVRIVYIVIGGLNNSDKELHCWEIFVQMWKRFCLLRSEPSPVHLRRKRWPLTGGRKLSPPFQAPVSENWLAGWLVSK